MQTDRGKKWNEIRMRLFKMVSVGVVDDPINQGYDIVSTLMLIVNLIGAFANTFDGVRAQYASLLDLQAQLLRHVTDHLTPRMPFLRSIANAIARIDVLLAWASVSDECHFIRPQLAPDYRIQITVRTCGNDRRERSSSVAGTRC